MAFDCDIVNTFIAGPTKAPPDVLFWGQRVFQFATMDSGSVTYTEAFCFALVEGATARQLTREELETIPEVAPV